METGENPALLDYFEGLEDPRTRESPHDLRELLLAALCAVLSGADGWASVALWGQVKLDWSVMGGEEAPVLRIRWTESDAPPVDYTGRRGFGSRLASGFLEQKLSGLVVYRFEPTGVLWQLTVPLPALGATLIRSSSSMSDHTNQRGNRPQSDA